MNYMSLYIHIEKDPFQLHSSILLLQVFVEVFILYFKKRDVNTDTNVYF